MNEIDEVERAAALAEVETGVRGSCAKIPLQIEKQKKQRPRRWTEQEHQYVRENYGRITEREIAIYLGRAETAVHLHINREMRLTVPSKSPKIMTAEQIAWGLGTDGKSIHQLMDVGLMPHRRLPTNDITRVIDRRTLLLWILDPMHWIYFKTERVGMLHPRGNRYLPPCYDFEFWEGARKVVTKARASWKDEWLTPGQAAAALGMKHRPGMSHNVNKAILLGNLKATRWGNWRILRSDLPPKGMMINVAGRIVSKKAIGRVLCGRCGGIGHNRLTCARRSK